MRSRASGLSCSSAPPTERVAPVEQDLVREAGEESPAQGTRTGGLPCQAKAGAAAGAGLLLVCVRVASARVRLAVRKADQVSR